MRRPSADPFMDPDFFIPPKAKDPYVVRPARLRKSMWEALTKASQETEYSRNKLIEMWLEKALAAHYAQKSIMDAAKSKGKK